MEDNNMVSTTETVEEVKETPEVKTEKTYTRDELNKIITAEKSKVLADIEAKQNEAQKLAKMKEEERLAYEKEKIETELRQLKSELNAKNLKDEAYKIATEKQIPISYLDLIDFSKETAESINDKIKNLADARSKDLEQYLNSKLKQTAPSTVKTDGTKADPFIEGFKNGWK